MTQSQKNDLLRAPEAAAYLGLSFSTLAKFRHRGEGPEYLKVSKRVVAYRKADLDRWIADINGLNVSSEVQK